MRCLGGHLERLVLTKANKVEHITLLLFDFGIAEYDGGTERAKNRGTFGVFPYSEQFARDRYGVEFDSRGWARCPHADRHNNGDQNPSFQLHKATYKCWSQQCFGERGVDVFGLVMDMEGLGLNDAKKVVAGYAGLNWRSVSSPGSLHNRKAR